jgi:hypothetical protein
MEQIKKGQVDVQIIYSEGDNITFTLDGKEIKGIKASKDEIHAMGLEEQCSCGDEYCGPGGKLVRCMASGGGSCIWYITDAVC